MVYRATVVTVLIASPSDVPEAREAVVAALEQWNAGFADSRGVVLRPWRFEMSAVPMVGEHPQALINSQGVDRADIVVALFGSRLGMPTPSSVSGTVEELERATVAGKPVHAYFSSAPHPNDVDPDQLKALQEFKTELSERALYGQFDNPDQLQFKVAQAIEHDLVNLNLDPETGASGQPLAGVRLVVNPKSQRELTGYDAKNTAKYRTRTWIEVSNQGTGDAEGLTFEPVGQTGVRIGSEAPTTIHGGQTRSFPVMRSWGSGPTVVTVRWIEQGKEQEKDFDIG